MSPSLSGVEAWSASDRLAPGAYRVRASATERRSSSAGNPQVQVDWKVLDGDFKGAEQRDWITATDAALPRIVQLLNAIGVEVPSEDFDTHELLADWLLGVLAKGPVCEMVVRNESWVGNDGVERESVKVKGYKSAGGPRSDVDDDASGFQPGPSVATKNDTLPFRAEPVPTFTDVKAHANRIL